MKSQYFGDLTDYRKYGLLRCLSANGEIKTGVCWMLTEGVGWVSTEHETEGASKFQYLTEPEHWRHFDPDLFDFLRAQIKKDRRSVDCIETAALLPCTTFFSQPLASNYQDRRNYFKRALEFFADRDLIFFDPDNGLTNSISMSSRHSNKYLYHDELAKVFKTGVSVLVFQYSMTEDQEERAEYLARQLQKLAGAPSTILFNSPTGMYFLLPQGAKWDYFWRRAEMIVHSWPGQFTMAEYSAADKS